LDNKDKEGNEIEYEEGEDDEDVRIKTLFLVLIFEIVGRRR